MLRKSLRSACKRFAHHHCWMIGPYGILPGATVESIAAAAPGAVVLRDLMSGFVVDIEPVEMDLFRASVQHFNEASPA